jgi:hypothetical protein
MAPQIYRKSAMDKLNSPDELNELLTVTSPQSWLWLTAVLLLLTAAASWALFATIETSVSGSGVLIENETAGSLQAVLYVSLADGKRIRPGMAAKISPQTVRSEEYGMLLARVASVEQLPRTQADMLSVLGNDALVQTLSASGLIVEVWLDIEKDASTPTGYQWTSATGPPALLWDGTFSDGRVITSQQRPIELLLSR